MIQMKALSNNLKRMVHTRYLSTIQKSTYAVFFYVTNFSNYSDFRFLMIRNVPKHYR